MEAVITQDADIVPRMTTVKSYPKARTIGDTRGGRKLRRRVELLDDLVRAYQEGLIPEAR